MKYGPRAWPLTTVSALLLWCWLLHDWWRPPVSAITQPGNGTRLSLYRWHVLLARQPKIRQYNYRYGPRGHRKHCDGGPRLFLAYLLLLPSVETATNKGEKAEKTSFLSSLLPLPCSRPASCLPSPHSTILIKVKNADWPSSHYASWLSKIDDVLMQILLHKRNTILQDKQGWLLAEWVAGSRSSRSRDNTRKVNTNNFQNKCSSFDCARLSWGRDS